MVSNWWNLHSASAASSGRAIDCNCGLGSLQSLVRTDLRVLRVLIVIVDYRTIQGGFRRSEFSGWFYGRNYFIRVIHQSRIPRRKYLLPEDHIPVQNP